MESAAVARSFKTDLTTSAKAFEVKVWPKIKRICGGGFLVKVEDEEKKLLDIYAGIDAWQVCEDNRAMRGIASRVQWNTIYSTFSIRTSRRFAKTEFEKRLEAITSDRGFLYPHLTVQAYIVGGIVTAGVVRTKDLFVFASQRRSKYRDIMNYDMSSTFIAIPWSDLRSAGIAVATV